MCGWKPPHGRMVQSPFTFEPLGWKWRAPELRVGKSEVRKMTNSTEALRGSENGAPSATATALPDKEDKRTAKVQKGRTLTAVPKPSGSRRSGPANRRKSQPKPTRTKAKATLGILTKEQRHEAGKALREKCPRTSHREVVLGRASVTSSS